MSQRLKQLSSILSIHTPDKETVEFLYQLNRINVSQGTILNIRQKTGKTAEDWYDREQQKRLFGSLDSARAEKVDSRKAVGFDEGKIHIRSAERNPATNEFDRYWKNAKFAACYDFDENGKKLNEANYAGTIDCKLEDFDDSFYDLLSQNYFFSAKDQVVLSDGANGYFDFLKNNCPEATIILDAMHTSEHLWNLGKKILFPSKKSGETSSEAKDFVKKLKRILMETGVEKFLEKLMEFRPKRKGDKRKGFDEEYNYFKKNKERMNFPEYIEKKYPIGSGIIEAAIKMICNLRFKRGSACWRKEYAEGLLHLRLIWFNRQNETFWNDRKQFLKKKFYLAA